MLAGEYDLRSLDRRKASKVLGSSTKLDTYYHRGQPHCIMEFVDFEGS